MVCEAFGPVENLQLKDMPAAIAGENEVVIDIEAAGVNFPDSLLINGTYQMKPSLPFIPGTEVAGTISAVGEKVNHLAVGQRVLGFCMLGGFAEQITMNAKAVMPVPDAIPMEEAAGLLTAHATAHHALRQRGQLQAGETLLVTGAAGGTGLAAVQIGKAIGAKVIAVCSSEEKLAIAKANGADVLVNSSEGDLKAALKSVTDGQGADVIYECVGGDVFKACMSNIAWAGRLLVIGFAGGDIPKIPVSLALVKGCSIVGVFWGTFTQKQPKEFMANMQELLGWYQEGKVKVIVDEVFALEDTVAAINKLTSRKVMGKVIVKP
ncbi:MAG: NADPH:quinone oxidoreductase family protein [Thiolinea sp.]